MSKQPPKSSSVTSSKMRPPNHPKAKTMPDQTPVRSREDLLFEAIESSNETAIIQLIANNGTNLEALNKYGETPVVFAHKFFVPGNPFNPGNRIATVIRNAGADLNVHDRDGESLISRIIEFEDVGLLFIFLQKGAELDIKNNTLPDNRDAINNLIRKRRSIPEQFGDAVGQVEKLMLEQKLTKDLAKIGAEEDFARNALSFNEGLERIVIARDAAVSLASVDQQNNDGGGR